MPTHKVLITGITGFVGPYLARTLIEEGNEVIGLVRRSTDGRRPKRLEEMDLLSEIKLVQGDITDLTSILTALQSSDPDWIFHLAAQSYVPESFRDPLGTFRVNCLGTQNLLEAVRLKNLKSRIVFAGSSEEYGLQFRDQSQYATMKKKYGMINPEPIDFPELPIDEQGFLRPMSPYATSKVYGDLAFRNYHNTFGLDTVVSRAFNHEGAGRGHNFVTSTIVRQVISTHLGETDVVNIGDVQAFRDWSHIEDIISGYILLAQKAESGAVYVQGSMKSYSVLSYLLHTITQLGHHIRHMNTFKGEKKIADPLDKEHVSLGKVTFDSNKVDRMLLENELEYDLKDEGIIIETDKKQFRIRFDTSRFRPSDVPLLMANNNRMKKLGFRNNKDIADIVNDQINYYLDSSRRHNLFPE